MPVEQKKTLKAFAGRWKTAKGSERRESEAAGMNDIERHDGIIDYVNSGDVVADAKLIIDSAQVVAHQAINVALIRRS